MHELNTANQDFGNASFHLRCGSWFLHSESQDLPWLCQQGPLPFDSDLVWQLGLFALEPKRYIE